MRTVVGMPNDTPTALARSTSPTALAVASDSPVFTPRQREMIRSMYADGSTEEEFGALMAIAEARRLSPLMKQIYFIQRWDSTKKRQVWSAQTSIEGLRVIAERTGLYDGADQATFAYKKDGTLLSATVQIYRKDRTRPVFSTVFYDEAVQLTRDGEPTSFWKRMPHRMLAKAAEADALHRSFPEDMTRDATAYEGDPSDTSTTDVEIVRQETTAAPKTTRTRAVAAPKTEPVAVDPPKAEPVAAPAPAAASAVDAEFSDDHHDVGSLILPLPNSEAWKGKPVSALSTEAICRVFVKGFLDAAEKTDDADVRADKLRWAGIIRAWAEQNGWSV